MSDIARIPHWKSGHVYDSKVCSSCKREKYEFESIVPRFSYPTADPGIHMLAQANMQSRKLMNLLNPDYVDPLPLQARIVGVYDKTAAEPYTTK